MNERNTQAEERTRRSVSDPPLEVVPRVSRPGPPREVGEGDAHRPPGRWRTQLVQFLRSLQSCLRFKTALVIKHTKGPDSP